MKTFSTRNRQAGFSLTELAIVLGVIGIIIGGVWTAASAVQERSRLSNALNQANIVAGGMTTLLSGGYGMGASAPCGASPPCDITAPMATAQVIPASMNGANGVSNPWNSNNGFTLRWQGTTPLSYRMSFYQVSRAGCVGLIMGLTNCNAGRPGCPVSVGTAGTRSPYSAPTAGNTLSTTGGPLSTTNAQTLCNANNYTGGTNSVEFDFRQ